MKPLFRWTIGSVIKQGLDILEESISKIFEIYDSQFDFMVCYNGLNRNELNYLKHITSNYPIELMHQNWATCPISDNCWSPRKGNDIEINGKKCGGTLWKVCPARIRIDSHEIIMDNDIVLLKKLPQIDEFLACNNKNLILEEPLRFYGRYNNLFDFGENLNSGLMGMYPGFNFEAEIVKTWNKNGKYTYHSQADEQGLLMSTLKNQPNIRINKQFVKELLANHPSTINGQEHALHFTQANRSEKHNSWNHYLSITRLDIGII